MRTVSQQTSPQSGRARRRVFWENDHLSRVLTLERIRGIKINDAAVFKAAGIRKTELAERASRILLQMVFDDGLFHADPHPATSSWSPTDGSVSIDFGMVGTLDQRTQDQLAELLLAITSHDPDRIVDSFLELGVVRERVNRQLMRRDLGTFPVRAMTGDLSARPLSAPSIEEARSAAQRHRLISPANLVALPPKTVMMDEGLGDNDSIQSFHRPACSFRTCYGSSCGSTRHGTGPAAWAARRWTRRVWASSCRNTFADRSNQIEGGGLEVGTRLTGFGPVLQEAESMVNRLVLGRVLRPRSVVGCCTTGGVPAGPDRDQRAGVFFGVGFVTGARSAGAGFYRAPSPSFALGRHHE